VQERVDRLILDLRPVGESAASGSSQACGVTAEFTSPLCRQERGHRRSGGILAARKICCTSSAARADVLSSFMIVMEPGRACERARAHNLLYSTLLAVWA
jgi:hypothetical protein